MLAGAAKLNFHARLHISLERGETFFVLVECRCGTLALGGSERADFLPTSISAAGRGGWITFCQHESPTSAALPRHFYAEKMNFNFLILKFAQKTRSIAKFTFAASNSYSSLMHIKVQKFPAS